MEENELVRSCVVGLFVLPPVKQTLKVAFVARLLKILFYYVAYTFSTNTHTRVPSSFPGL